MSERIQSLKEFYPYYLEEHSDSVCRRLHFVGTTGVLLILIYALLTSTWWVLWFLPICGYGFAWVGHFFFEKNRPATFKYPLYSLVSDFIMYRDMWIGRVPF
ncbi:membrane protein [gamma proteobacterium HTCC5015]|nr:membrane protein [gamma proteobacterium HTCC5015]